MTPLIGRDQLLGRIAGRLAAYRVVTLTGPGGAGKTRLAIATAARVGAAFPMAGSGTPLAGRPTWFVDLSAVDTPMRVPAAVADALGVRDEPGRDIVETLADDIGHAPALLVLDNCEQLVPGCAELAERLLHRCPDAADPGHQPDRAAGRRARSRSPYRRCPARAPAPGTRSPRCPRSRRAGCSSTAPARGSGRPIAGRRGRRRGAALRRARRAAAGDRAGRRPHPAAVGPGDRRPAAVRPAAAAQPRPDRAGAAPHGRRGRRVERRAARPRRRGAVRPAGGLRRRVRRRGGPRRSRTASRPG